MNQKPSRIFYGWWIVAASVVTGLYAAGAVFYGFTAIFEPIANDMNWSYTQISLASSLRGLEAGLLAPVIGVLVDRWGPRRLVFFGTLITVGGLLMLSQTSSLGMFYGAFTLIAIGMSCTTMTVLMTAVSNWFHKRIGLATGIAVSGFGLGGLLVPVIVSLTEAYDWRTAIIILALGMLVIVLPVSFLFRHRPEQYGYLPDGQVANGVVFVDTPNASPSAEVDVTARLALKSRVFWHITVAFTFHITVVSATITHVMPYLSSIDINRSTSTLIATAIPLVSIIGRLGLGWLGDRFSRKLVTVITFGVMGLGSLSFGYAAITGTWLLVPFLILFSIGYGGCNALRPSLARDYFGRANFGTIFGVIMGINMFGSIVGPPLAGWAYDNWGSYQGIWFVFAILPVISLILILTMPPARDPALPPTVLEPTPGL